MIVAVSLNPTKSLKQELTDQAVIPADVPKGYGLYIPEWEFQTPEGENITIKGTIQEVYATLGSLNPQMAQMNGFDLEAISNIARSDVEKRAKFPRVDCQSLEEGHTDMYETTMEYLRRVPGKPKNSAGPRECGRVSCAWKSATWWCNDALEEKELSSFGEIADGVQVIYHECTDVDKHYWWSSGEAYTDDDWSVQFGYAPC
ncbi:hypothetical protein CABS01_13305 [Colletotrichum abscissum]|uniref:Uncharacterized protein n=1 Tax=Colletotrichum abscissum TaxID=1671311 RepID=A0A9Q0B014_9PEZI|nr:uncharacterized protein CABS01_13305 [Colletotrichum abscissum]KAI3538717.1 hypothetical protein CABS02_11681 [Colletotrichum abscissum]KAK1486088.1 hypothetical protein CABS01_13305 [Colletotrichum abscissum]